jgi:hypothetical protein
MCQTKFVEKLETHTLCSITLFRKSCKLWYYLEKRCRAGQATDDITAHSHFMLDNQGYKHTLRIYNTNFFSTATVGAGTPLNATSVHTLTDLWSYTKLISFFLYFEMQGLATADLVHCNRDISLHETFSSFFPEFPLRIPSPDSDGLYQVSEK